MEPVPNFPSLGPKISKLVVSSNGFGPVAINPYQGIRFYSPDLNIIVNSDGVGIFVPPDLFGSGPTGPTGPGFNTIITTKGDLVTFSTVPVRLPVGVDNTILTADSTVPDGLAWKNFAVLDSIRLTGLDKVVLGQVGADYTIRTVNPPATRVLTINDPGVNSSFVFEDGDYAFTGMITFPPAVGGGTVVPLRNIYSDVFNFDLAGVTSVPASGYPTNMANFFTGVQISRVGALVTLIMPDIPIVIIPLFGDQKELPSLTPIPIEYRPSTTVEAFTPIYWGNPLLANTITGMPLDWRFRVDTNGLFTILITGNVTGGATAPTIFGSRPFSVSWISL
jgi:hypothetical protein